MKRASRRRPAAAAVPRGAVVVVILPAASSLDTLRAVLAQAFDGNSPSPTTVPAVTGGEDLIDAFLKECVDQVAGWRTQASVLAREFAKWAKTRGIPPLSCKAFAMAMKQRGFESKHSGKNWWLGLKLKCGTNASAEDLRRTSKRVRQPRQRHEPKNGTSS
jgi:hypothetical protein